MRAARDLVRLRLCAGSSEPSLLADAISAKISSVGTIITFFSDFSKKALNKHINNLFVHFVIE